MSNLLNLISTDGLLIEYCKKQNELLCLAAVKQNGLALKYVRNPSVIVCLEALKQTPDALPFIPYYIIEQASKMNV